LKPTIIRKIHIGLQS